MNEYYSLSQEDSNAAREYREYVESTHVAPEWYLIERAFKDGICHAKGIQYNFLNDYDKDMMKLMVKQIKEQKEFNQKHYGK